MDRRVTTVIDQEKCTGCGLCVAVCPSETISLQEGKATVTGERSLNCGHCQAVCPAGAVRVGSLDPEQARFHSFAPDPRWLPFGQGDAAQLVRLMASRRSCRNYQPRALPRELLADLVKIAVTAPSGSNRQAWSFTVLAEREQVLELAGGIGQVMQRFNRLAEKAWLRRLLRLAGRRELDDYFREHYQSVERGLRRWQEEGRDLLFHGAPAAIVVGALPGASCPTEDALLACGHLLLGAHVLGLGTCLIGYAATVLQRTPVLRAGLGLAPQEQVQAVVALGWPAETYQAQSGRRRPLLRWLPPAGG
ncbi:MAG: 4Fe-4S dicluster domain-containing protein [Desulfarculus sp.]|nr:MAG: 4Fe-4S dicluster domain-containing protein [Desulfarculus sp.]